MHIPPVSSQLPDFDRNDMNSNKLPLHLSQQNDDMETENTVTTATATTTTSLQEGHSISQDKLLSDGQLADQVTSIKTEADLVECKPSSLRQDSTLSLMSVSLSDTILKQEPMSVDNIHPNKGKDESNTPSESISTIPTLPHCVSSKKPPAPIRGPKPKKGWFDVGH